MSTTPDFERTDDKLVGLLSRWLMGAVGNDELLKAIDEVDVYELAPGVRTAVGELVQELRVALPGERGDVEKAVRETLEALAYGD